MIIANIVSDHYRRPSATGGVCLYPLVLSLVRSGRGGVPPPRQACSQGGGYPDQACSQEGYPGQKLGGTPPSLPYSGQDQTCHSLCCRLYASCGHARGLSFVVTHNTFFVCSHSKIRNKIHTSSSSEIGTSFFPTCVGGGSLGGMCTSWNFLSSFRSNPKGNSIYKEQGNTLLL